MAKTAPKSLVPSPSLKALFAAEADCDISAGSPLFLKYPDCYPMNPDGPPIPELVAQGKRAAGKPKPVPAPAAGRTRTKKPRGKK